MISHLVLSLVVLCSSPAHSSDTPDCTRARDLAEEAYREIKTSLTARDPQTIRFRMEQSLPLFLDLALSVKACGCANLKKVTSEISTKARKAAESSSRGNIRAYTEQAGQAAAALLETIEKCAAQ